MPVRFEPPELLIILLIIIMLFGVGRISRIAGNLGPEFGPFVRDCKGRLKKQLEKQLSYLQHNKGLSGTLLWLMAVLHIKQS